MNMHATVARTPPTKKPQTSQIITNNKNSYYIILLEGGSVVTFPFIIQQYIGKSGMAQYTNPLMNSF